MLCRRKLGNSQKAGYGAKSSQLPPPVAMANLCSAGIAAGVTEISLFFAYARKETTIATKPTTINA